MSKIKENIQEVLEDIKKYSLYPEKVKFIAVTKYVREEEIEEVLKNGIFNLGENRIQLIKEKYLYFKERNIADIKWDFIGNLQKNKVKYIADFINLIHSVNKLSLAKEIDKRAREQNRIIDVLIEVNVANEESKEGYKIQDFNLEILEYLKFKNLNIKGLMTMAPYTKDEKILRNVFSTLRKMKDELNEKYFDNKLTELSMGMSGDYKIALEEGATIIRVGTKIFE
ncbi:MAG: YggS family pyridoxal phosphate-dependent enzyme [Fusobacteriaceae bacterium]